MGLIDVAGFLKGHYEIVDKMQGTINEQATEIARLREALASGISVIDNCDIESGWCCCGESMDNHSNPMTAGHSPVDQGDYTAQEWRKSARATTPTNGD